MSAYRVAIDPGPGAAADRLHLVKAGPGEFQDERPIALFDPLVDRCADRDQLHLAKAAAVEAHVSRYDNVERLLVPQLSLYDSPPALDRGLMSCHRTLPVCELPVRYLRRSITADLRGARSGMRFGSESALDEGDDGARSIHGLAHLGLFGIRRLSRIPVAPSVLRQRRRAAEVGLQRGIYGDALSAQLHQVMRLPEGSIVPGKKGLQRLLYRLLAVKGRIAQQGR